MGNRLRLLKAALVRALLLPVLLALAWIIWGAVSASAASGDTGTAGPLGTPILSSSSLDTGSLDTAPAAAVTKSVTKPLAPVIGAVADTAGTVVSGASTAVSTVTTTGTTAAAPVLDKADSLVSATEDIVSAVPQLPVTPSLHVPSLPIPALPVPSVPVPSVPTPELPAAPVPGAMPSTPDPGAGGSQPDLTPRPHAATPAAGRPASSMAKAADRTAAAVPAGRVFAAVQTTAAGLPLAGTGLSLAELQMTTAGQRELAAISPATHKLHLDVRPGDGPLAPFAVSEGTSGNTSAGSEGSGTQAAEVAGYWDRTLLLAGARTFEAGQHLPASPAFDPGCSPD